MKKSIKIHIINFVLIVFSCKASKFNNSVTFSPTKGEIEFSKISSITNREEFNAFTKKTNDLLVDNMRQQIIEERKQLNKPTDSLELEIVLGSMKNSFSNNIFSFIYNDKKENLTHKYQDALIVITKKINRKTIGDYRVINRDNENWFYLAKADSVSKYSLDKKYKYSDENTIKIREFREVTKIINGYNCFKIEVENFNTLSDVMPNISGIFTLKQDMFVTEQIKSKYHPVVNYKTILDKYFPLEIIEKNNSIKGVETKFELLNLSLE